MISCEERRTKPYTIPVQCIPYKGLGDMKIRELANNIIIQQYYYPRDGKKKYEVAGNNLLYIQLYE